MWVIFHSHSSNNYSHNYFGFLVNLLVLLQFKSHPEQRSCILKWISDFSPWEELLVLLSLFFNELSVKLKEVENVFANLTTTYRCHGCVLVFSLCFPWLPSPLRPQFVSVYVCV